MDFIKICKEKNIRPSYNRIRVFEYLDSNRIHPTVDDIYIHLKKDIPTLSKTTIYNVLNLLIEKGIVDSVNINLTETRYEVKEIKHSHFQCEVCGKIYDIPIVETNLNDDYLNGYNVNNIDVTLRGICPACNKKNKKKEKKNGRE